MTYTRGPWVAIDCGNDAEWDVVKTDPATIDGHWFVATCHDSADDGTAEANARLIAAAPLLLEALEEFVGEELGGDANADNATRETDFYRPCISWAMRHRARAAIAFARGEAGK